MSLRPNASLSPSVIDTVRTFLPVAQMRQIARVTSVDEQSITGEVDVGTGHLATIRVSSEGKELATMEAVLAVLPPVC